MTKRSVALALLAAATWLFPAAWTQAADDEMQKAVQEYEAWMEAVSEQIAPVRFDDADVQSFLRHWGEFSSLDAGEEDDEEGGATDWQELADLDRILGHPAYRSWIAQNGLDGKDWLLKGLRIEMMVMREQMRQNRAATREQMQRQMALVDEQCENVAPETCKQIREAMAASAAMSQRMSGSWERMPEPTAGEAALLEKYQDQIVALMEEDEEEDQYWEGDEWEEGNDYESEEDTD